MKLKLILLTVVVSLIVVFAILSFRGGVFEMPGIEAPEKSAEVPSVGGVSENKSQPPDSPGYEVELTGVLRLVGSAPHYEFVLTFNGIDHYIKADAEEKKPLHLQQGKKVKVKGMMRVEKFIYPDPLYNHEKRFIYPDSIEVY
jgi:hypothetical protein